MSTVVRIHETGGPEVLRVEQADPGRPGAGEVLLRQTAVGLNFIDTYHRSGHYPLPELPAVLGREAAGVVEALGPGVAGLAEGDRVAYAMVPGAYAARRVIEARHLVKLPGGVTDEQAAAMMLKGLTAWYLLRRTHRVARGETLLWHAAAGGVGSIACQWAASLGAVVIGTVGSEAKAELARRQGCRHVIRYDREDFVERVREITGGAGVPVVYDSVGRTTFDGSLECLAPRGLMVSFGQSSGAVPPLELQTLSRQGSLYLTRPTLATYIAERAELERGAAELLERVAGGAIRIEVGQTWPLSEAERAHRELEGRRTSGSTVLLP